MFDAQCDEECIYKNSFNDCYLTDIGKRKYCKLERGQNE